VVTQYALLGAYDFLRVVEAPDNETVAHLSLDLGSRGTVNITTLPAISTEDFLGKLGARIQMGRAGKGEHAQFFDHKKGKWTE